MKNKRFCFGRGKRLWRFLAPAALAVMLAAGSLTACSGGEKGAESSAEVSSAAETEAGAEISPAEAETETGAEISPAEAETETGAAASLTAAKAEEEKLETTGAEQTGRPDTAEGTAASENAREAKDAGGETETAAHTEAEATADYVLNLSTKKFHRPDCPSVQTMSDENREDVEWSRERVVEAGYEPCKRCEP